MHLNTLSELLEKKWNSYLFSCIRDLVENGLKPERFGEEDKVPSRQDVTQYVAAWFKHIGMSPDECRQWMIDYCTGVLSAVSSSSLSQIRHSTKSNIKYIYKSDVPFDCGCEENRFKARCEPTCPVYDEMADRAKEREASRSVQSYEAPDESDEVANEITTPRMLLRDAYRDQFEKGMEFAQDHLRKKISKKKIVHLLNKNGFKTRTGKRWSYSILGNELRKLP